MTRNFRLNMIVGFAASFLAFFAFTCQYAEAQIKPFKVKGGGNAPEGLSLIPFDAGPYTVSGTATHLGAYSGFGIAYLTTTESFDIDFENFVTSEFDFSWVGEGKLNFPKK